MSGTELSVTEIQALLLEMLRDFDLYCSGNGITYFLSGGSLLGAVRHHGFIPWDNDVDIMLPRDDYERLMRSVNENGIGDKYDIVTFANGKSRLPFAKMINREVAVTENDTRMCDRLWIDLFPLDGLPEDENKAKRLLDKANRIKYRIALSMSIIGTGTSLFRVVFKIPAALFHKVINSVLFRNIYTKQMLKLCQTNGYDDAELIGGITWSCGAKELMRKEDLFPARRVRFEDISVMIPDNAEDYLKSMYGDYMKLPNEKDRTSHNFRAYPVK